MLFDSPQVIFRNGMVSHFSLKQVRVLAAADQTQASLRPKGQGRQIAFVTTEYLSKPQNKSVRSIAEALQKAAHKNCNAS